MTEPSKLAKDDCIYCGKPSGSAEHIVAASLGGLRTDRGILCGDCNRSFSVIDESLADDLRLLNAQVGVQHSRDRTPVRAIVEDPESGQSYHLSEGGKLQHLEAVVLRDEMSNGARSVQAVASTQKQADDFVQRMKKEGKPVKTERFTAPRLFVRQPQTNAGFGGTPSFRALTKTVLNLLAQWRPEIAREPWLQPVKDFVTNGGENTIANFDYPDLPDPRLPKESFEFQHRFVIVFDAIAKVAYARVSLFGVYEICVQLGAGDWERSESYVYDMDVLATRSPGDVEKFEVVGEPLCPPGIKATDPRRPYDLRLVALLKKVSDRNWKDEAPDLLAALNAARGAADWERHGLIVDALEGQRQRLLERAVDYVDRLGTHLESELGVEGRQIADSFQIFVSSDPTSKTGLTTMAFAVVEMLRMVVADHLLQVLSERDVNEVELKGLLGGVAGTKVVGSYLWDEMKKQHPALQGL